MKISLGLFLTFIIFVSEKTSEVEHKGLQKPIRVSVQRFSPAFAALEDALSSSFNRTLENSDEIAKLEFNKKVQSFGQKIVHIKSGEPEVQIVKLEGLKIVKRNGSDDRFDNQGLVSFTKSMTKKLTHQAQDVLDRTFSSKISLNSLSNSNSNLISNSESNLNLNDDESLNTLNHGQSIDVDGATFVIGNPEEKNVNSITTAFEPLLGSNIEDLGYSLTEGIRNSLKTGFGALQQNLGPISVSSRAKSKPEPNSLVSAHLSERQIKGQIILSEGAVYPGDRFQFYIQRVLGGEVQERGTLNPETGEFDILVHDIKGHLNVELRHDSGALIAFGTLKLNHESLNQAETLIQIKPADNAQFIGQALSYESFDEFEVSLNSKSNGTNEKIKTQIYIDGDQQPGLSDEKGRFAVSNLAAGSQMLIAASHKGYWNSLQIAEAGYPLKTILHSEKHMKSFLNLIEPYLKNSKIHSVIWGRVVDRGLPIEGVKVNLHGFEDIQPLYFNYRIPNPNLDSTSRDGFFAFINPPEGLHIIKTNLSELPLETTVVRMDHTSLVSIESAPKKNVSMFSFDAFQLNQQVIAKVAIPGMKASWKAGLNYNSSVPFFDTATNMVMDVDPQDSEYISTRYFIGRRRSIVSLPQFRSSWLSSVLASQKVNQIPKTTTVIGWIEKGAYKVEIYPSTTNTRNIYFDKSGNVVDKLIDGGGYIATNVPQGVVTSTLKDLKTGLELKRLSVAEPDKVSVNYISDLN